MASFADVLACMSFPVSLVRAAERRNAENEPRADVPGNLRFWCARTVGTPLLEQDDEWRLQERGMSPEGRQLLPDHRLNWVGHCDPHSVPIWC